MKKIIKLFLILAAAGVVLACSTLSFTRDESGKLMAETTLPLTLIEAAIENSSEFTQLEDLQLELREGYIFVSAASVNFEGFTFRDVSFHLELFAVDGQLGVELTNVNVAGNSLDDNLFIAVNQMLAERLAQSQEQVERAELVDVRVSLDGITLAWRLLPSEEN